MRALRGLLCCLACVNAESGCDVLARLAKDEPVLAVAFATASYASLAANWALSAARVGLPHALLELEGPAGASGVPDAVAVASISPAAAHAFAENRGGGLSGLWLARALALEAILAPACLQSDVLVLHSDVDVVFLGDVAGPLVAAACDHCLGAGQYPEALAAKWRTATGCFGFAAHRAGAPATAQLLERVVALTARLGDDQLALNHALDDLGFGAAARLATGARAALLDAPSFPVGGCDRWLEVAAALEHGAAPRVLHPNCVDKAGGSKEAWLRSRGAWLLSDGWAPGARAAANATRAAALADAWGSRGAVDARLGCAAADVAPALEAPAALVLVGDAAARAVRDRGRTATLVLGPGAEAAVRRYWRAAGFEVLDAGEAPPCRAVRDPVAALTPGARVRVEADEDVGAVLDALDALDVETATVAAADRREAQRAAVSPARVCEGGRVVRATLDVEAASGEAIRVRLPGADDAWTLVATRAGAAPARAAVSRGGAAELTPPGGGARATYALAWSRRDAADSAADRVLAKLGFSGADVRRLDGELRARVPPRSELWRRGGRVVDDLLAAAYAAAGPPASPRGVPPAFAAREAFLRRVGAAIGAAGTCLEVGGGDLAARHLACGAVDEARPGAAVGGAYDVALCAGCAVDDVAHFAAGSLVFVGGRFCDDAARLERALAAAGFHVVELGPGGDDVAGVLGLAAEDLAAPSARGEVLAWAVRRPGARPPPPRADPAPKPAGAALFEDGDYAAAYRAFLADAAAGAAGDRAEALFRAGVAAAAAGENGDAADRYDAAAAMDPRHDRALMNRGALAYAASDLAAAVGFLERAVFANPGNGAALENLRVAQETAHRGRGAPLARFDAVARDRGEPAALLRAGDGAPWPSAAALRRDLDARGRGPAEERRGFSLAALADGDALHAAGDDASAAAAYEAALGAPRGEPALAARAEYSLGVLDQAAGRADEAEARYGRAVALDPGLAAAWNNLGILKLHGDDVEDGVRCLGEAARLDGAAYGPNRAFAARLADRSRELAAPVFAAERRVDVVTTLYAAPAPRGGELLEALGRNAALASVRTLVVVAEGAAAAAAAAAGAKVAVVGAAGQPDYAALFAVAGDQRGPVALAHADVYFDDSLGCAADLLAKLPRPTLLAVTRRPEPRCVEASGGGHAPGLPLDLCAPQGHWAGEAVHGYDAFVFLPPAPAAVVAALAGVYQNRLGADLRVVDAFVAAGYDVLNPCLQVAAFHLHCSRQRTYAFNATVRDLGAPVDVFKLSHRRFHGACAPAPPARRAAPLLVASFPRSGSSMLRRAAERATGLWTGSTHYDAALVARGHAGEGLCGPAVFLVKTHHPAIVDVPPRDCAALLAGAAKPVLLLRRPWDALASYFRFVASGHHDHRTAGENATALAAFAVAEAPRWRLLAEHWRGRRAAALRYEDVVAAPDDALAALLGAAGEAAARWPAGERVAARPPRAPDDAAVAAAVAAAAGGPALLGPLGYDDARPRACGDATWTFLLRPPCV
ncbi:hypothetical protein AURANDRAFT_61697 [Aureococcus anophagefferens]|uniref:Sulfotransferase domain-containing protein n=1 Tax=Aureococcus anophagefferens TaxID=44056 RepID=F0Y118_AURAN|nr:hypothetical protein AURANDRAFT_61697 [Aureococcus anophagefferens]EGB11641.1 hypothetical protein AURANDRAFT_61697 [Aureococcus anophagefferens]|eukprot:XP_009033988.1 hypothetical protein AURANDRAFT_61697 [Aureococcus anophagefferens]